MLIIVFQTITLITKYHMSITIFQIVLVYIIVWLAGVFGINNASNAGRKIVIV